MDDKPSDELKTILTKMEELLRETLLVSWSRGPGPFRRHRQRVEEFLDRSAPSKFPSLRLEKTDK